MNRKDLLKLLDTLSKQNGKHYVCNENYNKVFYSFSYDEYVITNGKILVLVPREVLTGETRPIENMNMLIVGDRVIEDGSFETGLNYSRIANDTQWEDGCFDVSFVKWQVSKGLTGYAIAKKTGVYLTNTELGIIPEGIYTLSKASTRGFTAVKLLDELTGVRIILSAFHDDAIDDDTIIAEKK